ncbi:MAG: calcium-binding protein [Pseudomonadota bacterium]
MIGKKNLIVVTTLLALGGASLAAGVVMAQTGHGYGPRIDFEALDTDGDGRITRAEMEARTASRFAALDTDNSGTLSAQEVKAQAETRISDRAARMIERRDTDGDGALSLEELSKDARSDRMFARLDTNDDGAVSRAEFDAAKGKWHKRARDRRQR